MKIYNLMCVGGRGQVRMTIWGLSASRWHTTPWDRVRPPGREDRDEEVWGWSPVVTQQQWQQETRASSPRELRLASEKPISISRKSDYWFGNEVVAEHLVKNNYDGTLGMEAWLERVHRRGDRKHRPLRISTIKEIGTSLVVQWLRLCFHCRGTWVLSLVGELRPHRPHGTAKKKKR